MPTRRALLASALAAAPAAGCVSPGGGPAGPALVRRWVPDPAALQGSAHGKLFFLAPRAVARAPLAAATARKYRNYVRFLGVGRLGVAPADVAGLVQLYPPASSPRRLAVLRADLAADRVADRLADRYDNRERRDRGAVYWGGHDRAVGVVGDHLVVGAPTPTRDARSVVVAAMDARAGGAARWVAASADLAAVLAALGDGADVSAGTYDRVPEDAAAPERARFAGAVATGHRYRFGGGRTRSRYAFAFADAAAADPGAVRRWVAAHRDGRLFGDYGRVSVRRRGRTVVAEGTLPTDAV